jgi:PLP dependent protein
MDFLHNPRPRAISMQHSESPFLTVSQGLAAVRAQIAAACAACGRDVADIALVAVSKTKPADMIEAALQAGQRAFGENRVQEVKDKFPALRAAYPDLRVRLIGPLQTNKVREAVALCDAIDSLDRPKLAEVLAREMDREGRRPDILIQVNIGREPQKAGVDPDSAGNLLDYALHTLGLPVRGLMCIPPADTDPTPYFQRLRQMADAFALPQVSMGMSGDFTQAIAAGATHIRVGSAIFGGR